MFNTIKSLLRAAEQKSSRTARLIAIESGGRALDAARGKYHRAHPVSQLYEQGRVKHVGGFPELEDEMCDFGLDGLSSGRSPDRLDALVWAVAALTLAARGQPRVRGL